MKPLNEIREEYLQSIAPANEELYITGFNDGVAEMKLRAQVLMDAINQFKGADNKNSNIKDYCDAILETYKRSVE